MDRDGVINEEVDYLHRLKDIHILPGVADAVRRINEAGYLAIVITNQSVVARNLCSLEKLGSIHQRIKDLIARKGGRLDAVYFCPHHPGIDSPSANREFVRECECRKPKAGMIRKAMEDYPIDRPRSWMIGDSWRDVACGREAGLRTALVKTGKDWRGIKVKPDVMFDTLLDAVEHILPEGGRA